MAKFPTTLARQELGFVPTTAVRAEIDVRTGEGTVGAAIGQGLLGLGREWQLMNAKTQLSESNIAADDAEIKFLLGLEDEDVETYESGMQKLFSEIDSLAPRNRQAAAIYNQQRSRRRLSIALKVQQMAKNKLTSKSQATDFLLLQKAKKTGDFTPYKASIINGVKLGAYSAKEGEVLLDDADKEIKIKQKNDILTLALAQKKDGVTDIDKANDTIDKTELPANDKIDLKNQVANQVAREQNAQAIKNQALETELFDDIVAGNKDVSDIEDAELPVATKRRLRNDFDANAQREVAQTWALQDTDVAIDGVRSVLAGIEAGTVDINESRHNLSRIAAQRTSDGRSVITKKTFNKTLEQINKGGRDAVDIFAGEQTVKVKNSLTFRLTERDARLRIRSEARTLTPRERRQFSTTGFLLQVAKHQLALYDEGLAQRLRTLGIEDTSGKEAKAEAVKIWEEIKRKPLEQQINDFLSFSGQQLVRPVGVPIELWEGSNARNRAAIVNGVSKGMDNAQIEEFLIK